jgi:hypothetical protein
MNTFGIVKHIQSFDKVEYYSICLEKDDGLSLFELFIQKHTAENPQKLKHIMAWIRVIGDKYGAKSFFRNEAETADTHGLPPQGTNREPVYVEYNEEAGSEVNTPNNLRLYCFRANEHVVFLFNGDIKTADLAQGCDNVRPHFRLANKLTEVLEESFGNEINWNEDQTDIVIDEGFELMW